MNMKKIVTFGEVLLRLTAPGTFRFSQAHSFSATYGGSEVNVAASLAHFGMPVEFVTRLPENAIARACVDELCAHHLCTDGIVYGGERMGIYFMETGAAFRNSNVVYDRAGSSFSTIRPGMIDWKEVFGDACWFHWSGVAAALSQESADACLEALQVADRMGLTISCDLNFRKNLWKYGRKAAEVMEPLVQFSDVIFASEPEYKEILGVTPVGFKATGTDYCMDLDAFREMGEKVCSLVPRCKKMFLELRNAMTANHHTLAAVLYSDASLKHTRVYDIEPVVDCVGTGDAFVGGLIYGLLNFPGDDQRTLDFALAASCLKNTFNGDFNLATVAEVESLMKGNASGRVQR